MARQEANKALELEPSLPEAQAMLGIVAGIYDYDWKEAERRFRLAMSSDPVPPQIRQWYGFFYLLPIGRAREAAQEMERGLEDDPLNILSRQSLAGCYLAAGMLEEAETQSRKCLELNDALPYAHLSMAMIHSARGQLAAAIASAEKACSYARWPINVGFLAGLLLRNGEPDRAHELLEELKPEDAYSVPMALALFHLQREDVETAARCVEKAIEQRHALLHSIMFPVTAGALCSSPYWPKLLKMRNLPSGASHAAARI